MTPTQRQAAFDRLFATLARKRAKRIGLAYAGTVRKLPPPALPGEKPGETRYYVNAVAAASKGGGLLELSRAANAELRRAARWAETGEGRKPVI
jgi:hypothetical protein